LIGSGSLADEPDTAVWALWSAKEAAYKVVSKKTGPVSGRPLRYEVRLHDIQSGIVETPCGPVFFRLEYGGGWVHCLGSDERDGLDRAWWEVRNIEGDPRGESLLVRQAASERIAARLGTDRQEVEIVNRPNQWGGRPPVAFVRGEAIPGDLSLSHDEPYIAYAFTCSPDESAPRRP